MNWNDANSWAASLNLFGFTGWRLPSVIDIDSDGCNSSYNGTNCGWNVDTSTGELASLFYDILGNTGNRDTEGNLLDFGPYVNSGPFENVANIYSSYWTSTEHAIYNYQYNDRAWLFSMGGYQGETSKSYRHRAWAVHDGDIGTTVIPTPATAWLLLSALGGLMSLKHRVRSHKSP